MKFFCIILFSTCSLQSYSQQNATLNEYLTKNQYNINVAKDSNLNIIDTLLKNKSLFVLGEGGSHYLDLYDQLRILLLSHFTKRNFKYFFEEAGRSVAYNDNHFINFTNEIEKKYYDSVYSLIPYILEMNPIRQIYQNGSHLKYIGIDMEWPRHFYWAMRNLFKTIDNQGYQTVPLVREVTDTTYLHFKEKTFLKFYKDIQRDFFRDSSSLKRVLGDKFETFKYLISNPNTTPPHLNRNKPMAKNLLNEIEPLDTSAIYFLDVGMAHSLPNAKGSLVNLLSKSEILKNKIVVMNVYCDNCKTKVEKVNNWALKFMKGDILNIFRDAAKMDLTLFDLSKLPPEFDYIKEYGSFLLYAKNKN